MSKCLLDIRTGLIAIGFVIALALVAIRDLFAAPVVVPGISDSAPFYSQYEYYRADAVAQQAECCLQDLEFECAALHYREANQLLAISQVSDQRLAFRIDVGLALSEALQGRGEILRHRLEDLFNKFASNLPPVKMKFDTGGGINDNESVYEAQ